MTERDTPSLKPTVISKGGRGVSSSAFPTSLAPAPQNSLGAPFSPSPQGPCQYGFKALPNSQATQAPGYSRVRTEPGKGAAQAPGTWSREERKAAPGTVGSRLGPQLRSWSRPHKGPGRPAVHSLLRSLESRQISVTAAPTLHEDNQSLSTHQLSALARPGPQHLV